MSSRGEAADGREEREGDDGRGEGGAISPTASSSQRSSSRSPSPSPPRYKDGPECNPQLRNVLTRPFQDMLQRQRQGILQGYSARATLMQGGAEAIVRRLALQRLCRAHQGCVNTIEFTEGTYGSGRGRDGREVPLLVSGSDDHAVVLSDVTSGKVVARQETQHTHNIFAATPVPGKPDHVVTAAADGEVHLVSMLSRAAERELVNCTSFATVARFLPGDAHVFVAAEMNGQAYLVDLREETHRTLLSSRVPKGGSTALAFDPARPWTMAYSGGRCVSLFDLRTMSTAYDEGALRDSKPFARYLPGPVARGSFDEGPSHISFSQHRRHEMLVNFRNSDLFTIDVADFKPVTVYQREYDLRYISQFEGRRNERTFAKQASYFLDEAVVVTGCDSGRIAVWDRYSAKLLRRFKADHHIVNCVAAHPSTEILVSSGIDNDIKVWSPASTGKRLRAIMEGAEDVMTEQPKGQPQAARAARAAPPAARRAGVDDQGRTPAPAPAEAARFGAEILPGEEDDDASSAASDESDDPFPRVAVPRNVLLMLRRLVEGQAGAEAGDIDILRFLMRGQDEDEEGDEEGDEDGDDTDDDVGRGGAGRGGGRDHADDDEDMA